MPAFLTFGQIALVGIGATAAMDAWLLLMARLGVPTTSFAMVGRWVGHFARGTFAHVAISKAAPIPFELSLGWLTHYVVGIAYAAQAPAVLGMIHQYCYDSSFFEYRGTQRFNSIAFRQLRTRPLRSARKSCASACSNHGFFFGSSRPFTSSRSGGIQLGSPAFSR